MPAPLAKPKPAPPVRNPVRTTGTPAMFEKPAGELIRKLGWEGEPDWETLGIRVEDAWNYAVKTLHESFIAGALGHEKRDPRLILGHFGLLDAKELEILRVLYATPETETLDFSKSEFEVSDADVAAVKAGKSFPGTDAADLEYVRKAMDEAYAAGAKGDTPIIEVEGKAVSTGAAMVQVPGKAG